MKTKRIFITGTVSGLTMGITLFIAGAIFSRIIYGPQFAPSGTFELEQLNAWYFIWTKLLIGVFFGVLFTFLYEILPLSKRLTGGLTGLKYGFIFWLVISLWNVSHPLIYGSFNNKNELFWLLYSLCGFLAFGYTLGCFYKRIAKNQASEEQWRAK